MDPSLLTVLIPERLRVRYERQGGVCILCGHQMVDPSREHIIPATHGGTVTAVTCKACNNRRGIKLLTEEQLARFCRFYPSSARIVEEYHRQVRSGAAPRQPEAVAKKPKRMLLHREKPPLGPAVIPPTAKRIVVIREGRSAARVLESMGGEEFVEFWADIERSQS